MGRSSRLCGSETYTRYAGVVPSLAEWNLETGDQGVQAVPPSLRATTLRPIIPNTTAHPILFSTATSPRLSGCRRSITGSPRGHNASTSTPSSANVPALLTTSLPSCSVSAYVIAGPGKGAPGRRRHAQRLRTRPH